MIPTNLLASASKIFGLWLFVLAALEFRSLIYFISAELASPSYRDNAWMSTLFILINLVLLIVVGLILIYKADRISRRLGPADVGAMTSPVTKIDIIEIVIITIGFVAILDSVPLVLQKLVSYAYFNDYQPHERNLYWGSNEIAAMIFAVFEFISGMFLLFNARHFAKGLHRLSEREDARRI